MMPRERSAGGARFRAASGPAARPLRRRHGAEPSRPPYPWSRTGRSTSRTTRARGERAGTDLFLRGPDDGPRRRAQRAWRCPCVGSSGRAPCRADPPSSLRTSDMPLQESSCNAAARARRARAANLDGVRSAGLGLAVRVRAGGDRGAGPRNSGVGRVLPLRRGGELARVNLPIPLRTQAAYPPA